MHMEKRERGGGGREEGGGEGRRGGGGGRGGYVYCDGVDIGSTAGATCARRTGSTSCSADRGRHERVFWIEVRVDCWRCVQ